MINNVRHLREKLGLSQKELARSAGTSQQQIARIETTDQAVKLDLALQLAAALQADLGQVFPGTKALLGKGKTKKRKEELFELHYNPKALNDFASVGVDLDPATWRVVLRLRGGASATFVIPRSDVKRLQRNLEDRDPSTPFFVFDSSQTAVAINLNHLLHYQELWDSSTPEDWHDTEHSQDEMSVWFSDSPQASTFNLEADESESDDDPGDLQYLLFKLQTLVEPGEFFSIVDADGESAFFRTEDVALLSIPLQDLNPRHSQALMEAGEDEGDTEDAELEESDPGTASKV